MSRPKGLPNLITRDCKQSIMSVYEALGGAEAMLKWAKRNQTEYYRMLVAIVPKNVDIDLTKRVLNVNIQLSDGRHQSLLAPEAIDSISESCN